MTTPLFPSVIGHNVLDGGTDAQDGNAYPGPLLQEYAAAVVGASNLVSPPHTLLFVGDSISLRNGPLANLANTAYTPGDTYASNESIVFRGSGFFTSANALLNSRFRPVYNGAIGGETTTQINARISGLISTWRPAYVSYLGGTNDVQGNVSAESVTIPNIQEARNLINAGGATMILYTIPPITGLTAAQKQELLKLNQFIRWYALNTQGVIFGGDFFKVCAHPDTGDWLASGEYGMEAALSTDNIHPTDYAGMIMGYEVYRRLVNVVPDNGWSLGVGGSSSAWDMSYNATNGLNPRGNLLANGKMLGTGGTVSGTGVSGNLAAGWATQNNTIGTGGTIVLSKVARNATAGDPTTFTGAGEWQQIVASGASSACNYSFNREAISRNADGIGASDNADWSIGDKIYAQCAFQADSSGWGTSSVANILALELECWNGGTVVRAKHFEQGSPQSFFRMPSGLLRTPEILIPSGTTRIYAWIYYRGQGTVRVSDAEIRRVV